MPGRLANEKVVTLKKTLVESKLYTIQLLNSFTLQPVYG